MLLEKDIVQVKIKIRKLRTLNLRKTIEFIRKIMAIINKVLTNNHQKLKRLWKVR